MRHIFASINYIEERHVIYLWSAFCSSFNCYTLWSHFSEPSRILFHRVIWMKNKQEIELSLYLILVRIKALERLSNHAQVQNEQVLMDSSFRCESCVEIWACVLLMPPDIQQYCKHKSFYANSTELNTSIRSESFAIPNRLSFNWKTVILVP